MKTHKTLGLFLVLLLLATFVPVTHYKALAETERENETDSHYKTSIEKEVEVSRKAQPTKASAVKQVKKAKKASTTKVSTKKVSTKSTTVTKTTTASTQYSSATVATHNSETNCWTIINGNVYNLTSWIHQHPVGSQAILSLCGIDGTQAFNDQHGGQSRPEQELKSFLIGTKA